MNMIYVRARSALNQLNASCSRDEWVTIAMASKNAGLSFDDFHAWSKTGCNYESEKDCESVWKSIKPKSSGITEATLYYLAYKNGWNDTTKLLTHAGYNYGDNIRNHETNISLHSISNTVEANNTSLIWERCLPATQSHGYIMRKQGDPEGLRVYPDDAQSLIVNGINVAGYLAVPCYSDGKLQTLQFIPPIEGKKLNLTGAVFNDGYFIVGEITNTLYVCEGISHGWAINQACGLAAVVCFSASRMKTVALVLRQKFPNATIIIVPDRGMEDLASKIALEVSGQWIKLPNDKTSNYDVNDYAMEFGYDALANLLIEPNQSIFRYKLLSVSDLHRTPKMQWIVKGIIPKVGLTALYGASGSGKSFLLLDLALTIATGGAIWFGRRIKSVPITYVCLEGESGLSKRVDSWFTRADKPLPNSIRFVTQPFNLLTNDVDELAKAIVLSGHAGGIIILDTLNRAAPGADENSSVDMGKIISSCSKLQSLSGGVILLAHHTGKDEAKKMRGHTSLPAALDGAIEVIKSGASRQWSVAKSKDDKDGDTYQFELEVVNLSIDEDGDAITSCIVVPRDNDNQTTSRIKEPKSGNQRIVWNALGCLFKQSKNYGKGGAPATKACIEYEFAIENTMNALPCDDRRKKERTKASITALVSNNFLRSQGGWLWIP